MKQAMEQQLDVRARRFKPYPRYRDSGVDWLGMIPAHWDVKRLKQTSSINDDALPESADPELALMYVDIASVDSTNGIVGKEPLTFAKAPSRARRQVRHGDVIVSCVRTYLRAIAPIVDPEPNLVVSTGFAVVRPRSQLTSAFAAYALRATYFVERVVAHSNGVSYPAINASEMATFGLALPPGPEQRAIAAFLDRETGRIDALVAKKERLIELLQEKRTALITRAVTKGLDPNAPMKDSPVEWVGEIPAHWEKRRLRQVVVSIKNGTTARQLDYGETDFRVTRIETISLGHIDYERVGFVEYEPGLDNYVIQEGDVLFSHINSLAMVGNCAIYRGGARLFAGMNLLRLRPATDVSGVWLWNWLRGSIARETVKSVAKHAINQVSVSVGSLKDLHVLVPPTSEQRAIANFLERKTAEIDALRDKIREGIDRLKEFRTGLISAAVTGKIDVRDEVP